MEKMMDIKGIRFIESILWELKDGEPVAIKEPLKIKYILESKQDSKQDSKENIESSIESKNISKADSIENIESNSLKGGRVGTDKKDSIESKNPISEKTDSKNQKPTHRPTFDKNQTPTHRPINKTDSIESNSQIKWAYIAFKTTQHLSHKLIESALDSITQSMKTHRRNITESLKKPSTDNTQSLTQYDIKNKVIYKDLSDKSNFFAKNNMFDKIGFHLPLKELDNLVCHNLDSTNDFTKNIESKNPNATHHPINDKIESKNPNAAHRPTFDRIQTPTNRPIEINPDSINFPLKYPFAPGTYIELEINEINEINETNKLNETKNIESKQDSKENTESNIESIKEKTYTIVFAFDKSQNMPNINDKYIVIDTSFYLGIKENLQDSKNTQDSKLKNPAQTPKSTPKTTIATSKLFEKLSFDLKKLNEFENFENLHEAVIFITLCHHTFSNSFNDFRIYPQLTGKIGYIYHIFDTFDKDFLRDIKSEFEKDINEGSKYLESLQYDFVNKIVNLYMNKYLTPFGITFKPQVSEDSKLQLMREFIESLNDIFKIYAFKPNVEIADMDETLEGTYTLADNTIRVSRLASNLYYPYEIFMILVHEYRHFFVNYLTQLNYENSDDYSFGSGAMLIFLKDCLKTTKHHKIIFDSFGDPYRLNPHEKDAFLTEQILNLVIESTFAIRFNMTSNSKLR